MFLYDSGISSMTHDYVLAYDELKMSIISQAVLFQEPPPQPWIFFRGTAGRQMKDGHLTPGTRVPYAIHGIIIYHNNSNNSNCPIAAIQRKFASKMPVN